MDSNITTNGTGDGVKQDIVSLLDCKRKLNDSNSQIGTAINDYMKALKNFENTSCGGETVSVLLAEADSARTAYEEMNQRVEELSTFMTTYISDVEEIDAESLKLLDSLEPIDFINMTSATSTAVLASNIADINQSSGEPTTNGENNDPLALNTANLNMTTDRPSAINNPNLSKYYDENGNYKNPRFTTDRKNTSQEAIDNSKLTTGNQKYTLVEEYTGDGKGQISKKDYDHIVGIMCQESGKDNGEYNTSEFLGIASSIFNRYESGDSRYGGTLEGILNAENQYSKGSKYIGNGQWTSTDWGKEKIALAQSVLNDALDGTRNLDPSLKFFSAPEHQTYTWFKQHW